MFGSKIFVVRSFPYDFVTTDLTVQLDFTLNP
jgi:hypothetical protein